MPQLGSPAKAWGCDILKFAAHEIISKSLGVPVYFADGEWNYNSDEKIYILLWDYYIACTECSLC